MSIRDPAFSEPIPWAVAEVLVFNTRLTRTLRDFGLRSGVVEFAIPVGGDATSLHVTLLERHDR